MFTLWLNLWFHSMHTFSYFVTKLVIHNVQNYLCKIVSFLQAASYRKLLYNKEIPKYRTMVEDFYNSVTQMQRVSKSALDEDLKEICDVSFLTVVIFDLFKGHCYFPHVVNMLWQGSDYFYTTCKWHKWPIQKKKTWQVANPKKKNMYLCHFEQPTTSWTAQLVIFQQWLCNCLLAVRFLHWPAVPQYPSTGCVQCIDTFSLHWGADNGDLSLSLFTNIYLINCSSLWAVLQLLGRFLAFQLSCVSVGI